MESRIRQPSTLELLLGHKSGDSGVTELAGLALLWLWGSLVLLWKSRHFARLGSPVKLRYPLLILLHCLTVTVAGCLQRRVAGKWRRNITRKLHRFYFEKQNFYRLQSDLKENLIMDAELRICRDVPEMAQCTAQCAACSIEALVKTLVICGAALLRRRFVLGFLPPLAFLACVKLVLSVHPADKQLASSLQHFEQRLKQHFQRLHSRSQEILMMQGETFELDLLQKALRDTASMARRFYDLMFPVEMAEWTFLHSTQSASILELLAFTAAALQAQLAASFRLESFLYIFQNFISVCSSWNAFLSARTLLASTAATSRVKQLYVRLEALEAPKVKLKKKKEAKEALEVFVDKGDVLSFRSVTIHTPAKQALLRDLTVCISQPLLLCGPAGCGKTALLRCLFGVWPVGHGQIGRPGGAARTLDGLPMPEDILYLPEEPLLGWAETLSDELTFPRPMSQGLAPEELYRYLAYVGLEHLQDCQQLSLREKQAMGFARLLFHRPRFAILDGTTSALGVDLERRFLRLLRELGICYVTVVRRASESLKEEHSQMLLVQGARGEDTRGWKHVELPMVEVKPRCRCSAEAFQRLEAVEAMEMGDGVPESRASGSRGCRELRWKSPAARLWATLQLGLLTSGRRRTILQKLGLILLLLHARTRLYWRFCAGLSGSLRAMLNGARGLKDLLLCAFAALGCGLADQLIRYQAKLSILELWSGAVNQLQRKLLRELTLLRVEVSEPMQRLSEVRGLFEALGSSLSEALLPVAQLLFLLPSLCRHLRGCSLLFLLHFLWLRAWRLEVLKDDASELFLWRHRRLRLSAESLALSCRATLEQKQLEEDFERLSEQRFRWSRLLRKLLVNLADVRQLPAWILRLFSLKFFLSFKQRGAQALSETFLFDRMMQAAFVAVQQLHKCLERLAHLDAQCLRCLRLVVAVEAAGRATEALRDEPLAPLATGDGVPLARRLRVDLTAHQPLMICGPRGFEAPLCRRLLGDRPARQIVLATREPYVPAHCRLLAQLAYPLLLRLPSHAPFTVQVNLPDNVEEQQLRRHFQQLGASSCQVVLERGSRKGLIYFSTFEETIKAVARPQDRVVNGSELCCEISGEATQATETVPQLGRMRECLQKVGLEHLLTREPDGWFARRAWPELLSPEEQQRLSVARVLYHQPSFCLLEDALCHLPAAQEAELHSELLRAGVTPVVLCQEPFLEEIYRRRLQLGLSEGDGWKLEELA